MATARVDPAARSRAHLGPFSGFFLFPWVGGTLIFLLLVVIADPSAFESNWPAGLIMSGVWAFWCFIGYVVNGRRDGAGFWRMIH